MKRPLADMKRGFATPTRGSAAKKEYETYKNIHQ
jgi:hypothetical protein